MYKYRAEITKGEEIRYISHLDYAGGRTELYVVFGVCRCGAGSGEDDEGAS